MFFIYQSSSKYWLLNLHCERIRCANAYSDATRVQVLTLHFFEYLIPNKFIMEQNSTPRQ
jgi:hypothetical protein